MADVPDETVNKVLWSIPNVLCLIGSRSGDEWNAMTASWVTQVAMEPVLVAVSVDNKSLTLRLIEEGGSFSVNLWSRDDTKVFVKFSKPATKEGTTLNGRPFRTGSTGVPILTDALGFIECSVRETHDLGSHSLVIGEVVDIGFQGAGEETAVARIEDTRMKYGGVKRGGH